MEYKSVHGNKRPAADDGSSDEPTLSWNDVVVSEEVVNAAALLSAAQVPTLHKKSKPLVRFFLWLVVLPWMTPYLKEVALGIVPPKNPKWRC